MNPSKKTGWAQRQEPRGSGSSWDVDGWVGWSGWVGWVGWGQFRPKKWPARFCRDLFAFRVLLGIHVVLLTACRLGRGVPENTFIQSGREKVFAQNPCPTSYFLSSPTPPPNKKKIHCCCVCSESMSYFVLPVLPDPHPQINTLMSLSLYSSLFTLICQSFIHSKKINK